MPMPMPMSPAVEALVTIVMLLAFIIIVSGLLSPSPFSAPSKRD
jgi:hypothetical protein